MTLSINGNDISDIVHIAATVGSIVAALVIGLIVYLMVRPPRHVRDRRKAQGAEPAEAEELWRIVDLMERRLAVLERALADKTARRSGGADDEQRLFAPVDDDRDSGRTE
jgi:hypothetical protein